MPTYLKVLLHIAEVLAAGLVVILLGFLAHTYLGIDVSGDIKVVLAAVLAGVPKYFRASPDNSIPDYVNHKP